MLAEPVQPDSSGPFAAPRSFTPVCLLSRAQLPLSYLDTFQHGSRLFSAHIQTLEACRAYTDGSGVLIAEEMKEGRLYAIERAQRRTYALCRLGTWVKSHGLEEASTVVLLDDERQSKRQAIQPIESGQPWWSRATVPLPKQEPQHREELQGLPRLDVQPVSVLTEQHAATTGLEAISGSSLIKGTVQANVEDAIAVPSAPATAQELLQDLAKHYLEALYLSRTSLAYFTKGPLSRIRAAIANPGDTGLQSSELIWFLRESILTATVMDKKHRDSIAALIKELSVFGLETPVQPTKAKKKRKWKSKRDKAGFYVDEKDHVEQWWRSHDNATAAPNSAETVDAGLKRRMPALRSRETYLQLILALEVLALEATVPPRKEQQIGKSCATESQTGETQGQDESQPQAEARKSKAKKPQDLAALMETLVDRLCIWHSLESNLPANKSDADGAEAADGGNDELKSFCVEVIIPFYMSRIPQHAATINKKLGGPSAPTPAKRKSTSSRKPGEPAVRPAPEKRPRKSLSRVASDALHHGSRPMPSLARSATDSDALLAHIKRENSEAPVPLDSIPAAKLPQPRKRTSLMHSISFNRREVDLSAMSQANEAKMRKQADLDEKLREVLTAVKKPNRALAVKEVAESADASFAKATARSRPSAGQRTKSSTMQQSVHVAATPKHGRTIKATPARHARAAVMHSSGTTGTTHVPSSSAMLMAQQQEVPSSSFAAPQTGHRPRHAAAAGVEETPSRGFAKFMPRGLVREPGTLESPIAARHTQQAAGEECTGPDIADSPILSRHAPRTLQQTPLKPVRSLSLVPTSKTGLAAAAALVAASPNVVRTLSPTLSRYTGELNARQEKGHRGSIYNSLGWEDDYEELA